MTHDVHDIERELEDVFAARAAETTVSGDAAQRIDARARHLRHRSYMRRAASVIAVVSIVGASAVVATSGHGKKEKVSVADATLPTFSAPEFSTSEAKGVPLPAGTVSTIDARAYCMKVESMDGKPKCTQPYSLVNVSSGGVSVTTELGTPPFFIDHGSVSIHDFYPPQGRLVKVRRHDAILTESTLKAPGPPSNPASREPIHEIALVWTERPGLLVRVAGFNQTEQAVFTAAETLDERTTRVPMTYVTNTFASSAGTVDVMSNGKPVPAGKLLAGVWSDNGRLCFGVLQAEFENCHDFDRNSSFAVAVASKYYEPYPIVMGTVRPDATTVNVTFSNGKTLTSNVGAVPGLGVGFWAVDWPKGVEPREAVALDAHGGALARLDVQRAFPAAAPGFTVVRSGSLDGHDWQLAEGTVNGVPCAEVAYLQASRYFCNLNMSPIAVGAVENFTFARLAPNATHARIARSGSAPIDMTVVRAAGMNIAIGPRVDGTVVATADDGAEIAHLPTVLANNGVITSATPLGSGTAPKGAWQSVITAPPLLWDTAANAAAGKHEDGTLCTGASYGEATGLTCVTRGIYGGFITGHNAAAATLKDPPVMVGVVDATVPKVEVRFANGSVQRVATTSAPGVAGVRVWSIGMPAAIKELVSLDASGQQLATSGNVIDATGWPGG